MCRNMAALVCLLLISSSQAKAARSFVTKILLEQRTVRIIVPAIVVFSMALYSYQLFQYRIVHVPDYYNVNETRWDIYQTAFGDSVHKSRLEIAATILRDCVNLLILVILNCLIVFRLKLNLRNKKRIIMLGINEAASRSAAVNDDGFTQMQGSKRVIVARTSVAGGAGGGGGASTSTAEDALRNIKRKENRQTLMVLLTCFNYLIGRLPLLYLFVKRNLFVDYSNFGIYAILIAYVSYMTNFIFYYASNNRFRSSVNFHFKKAFSFCGRT